MADNPDEWFDVVDAQDRVIGRERRAVVHAKNLLHRAVHILVQRENGDVFVQQRSLGKDTNPGRWDSSSSGHLDSGEDYNTAAQRELREELGIQVERLELVGVLPASRQTGHEFVRIYRARSEGPFILHPEEIAGGKWVSIPQLRKWMTVEPSDFAGCFHVVWQEVESAFILPESDIRG